MDARHQAELLGRIDEQRRRRGFLGVRELLDRHGARNTLLDPLSVLIGRDVAIGAGNVFYPNVILEAAGEDRLQIGDGNTFYPGTLLVATHGPLVVGDHNQFGEGGVSVKANAPGAAITIGDRGRYLGGVQVFGRCDLGSGTQLIGGPLTVQDCALGAGESFASPAVERRGGLLKGFGTARGLRVGPGQVINGQGTFEQRAIESQAAYHPRKPAG